MVRAARRKVNKMTSEKQKLEKRKEYYKLRNKYIASIHLTKQCCWERFATKKGKLDIRRPPTVHLGERLFRMVAEARYLGVVIGTRFNMLAHITHICNKSKLVSGQLASVAKSSWGQSVETMKAISRGVFVPVITYAAAGWADNINVRHIRRLRQAQRFALIRVTKAYRTISTDALCVIAAATPIELLVVERKSSYFLRKNIGFQHFSLNYTAHDQVIAGAEKRNDMAGYKCTQALAFALACMRLSDSW
ncbi:hypothetical protein M0802_014066 [Mischocyttarus mexicanus]|nr:hypothetical protein M0802_014066 [Mischocyttarus mexicanus]